MTDDFSTEPLPEPHTATDPGAQPPAAEKPEHAAPTPPAPEGRTATEAWAAVVARMNDLGDAVSDWARAASDNPENRRRLDDVKRGVNDIAGKADETFKSVAGSEIGQHVKASAVEAGQAIGAAAATAGRAAAPVVATTFAGIAEFFGTAAERVEEAAARKTTETAGVPEPTVPSADVASPPVAPEPPAAPEAPAPPAPPEVGE